MVEGNNYGVVKIFVHMNQELMKEMQFSWYYPFVQPPTLATHISFKKLPNDLPLCHWKNGSDSLKLEVTIPNQVRLACNIRSRIV